MLKENKIRNKALTFWHAKKIKLLAIADIAKAKIFRLKFLESILLLVILVFGC
jgi:hypothetical protein